EPRQTFAALQEWEQTRRLVFYQVRQEEGVFSGLVLEGSPVLAAVPNAPQVSRLGAYLLLAGAVIRMWGSNKGMLDRAVAELRLRAGRGLSEPHRVTGPAVFSDVVSEAQTFPFGLTDPAQVQQRVVEGAQRYFEDVWIHRPLKSLSGV